MLQASSWIASLHAQALNGREAGLQAAHQALNKFGSAAPGLGFIIASHHYQVPLGNVEHRNERAECEQPNS